MSRLLEMSGVIKPTTTLSRKVLGFVQEYSRTTAYFHE